IELTFREISNHLNTTENKKINKAATTLLFKDDALLNYMFRNDENTVKKMYTLVDDLADLDQSCKAIMRNRIREKYPNFKFHVSEEKTSAPRGMLVTAKKLEEKKALLERMQDVDIPANAKEIEEAREKGDLKENAEYKAAKEHQHKLNNDIAKLQTELNRAIVFDPTTVTTAIISFATEVTLHNNKTNEDERYTILGPWESDPDNGVISYMAPFGNALMDYKIGENIQFSINEFNYDYTVKEINVAKI
ncbi:MAG: transcription elongation factor GreA, partial [Treponemataceae bacterium]|nr:transcription elongation factor GreA [Treponemataceae bacterium]